VTFIQLVSRHREDGNVKMYLRRVTIGCKLNLRCTAYGRVHQFCEQDN
jgi:hypothetical protein